MLLESFVSRAIVVDNKEKGSTPQQDGMVKLDLIESTCKDFEEMIT